MKDTIEKEESMQERFYRGAVREYRDEFCLKRWEEKVEKRMSLGIPENLPKMEALETYFEPHKRLKILSVGSGWGEFALAAGMRGHQASGIDPSEEHIIISKWRAKEAGVAVAFTCGIGEDIPYSDESFDVVDCHSVLEHVQDVEKVIREMVRVLRPGGVIHIDAPNYLYPTEPHYQIYRMPFAPKIATKIYLKIIGKDTSVLDSLNFITPIKVNRILNDINKTDEHGISVQKLTENNAMGDTVGKLPLDTAKTFTSKFKRIGWNAFQSIYEYFGVAGSIHLLIRKREV